MHRRTYHPKTRAEIIRFSEGLFQALPQEMFHDEGNPFEILITGDTASAKSLVPLAGLYGLSDTEDIADLLAQDTTSVTITQTSPFSIDTYLNRNGLPKQLQINGKTVPTCFGHDTQANGDTELWMLGLGNKAKHGIHIVTIASVARSESRKLRNYPAVPLFIDIRRTMLKSPIDKEAIGMEKALHRATAFEKRFRPGQRLAGDWAAVAENDPSNDVNLERSVVIYVNENTRHGKCMLASPQFQKFWNQTDRTYAKHPKHFR